MGGFTNLVFSYTYLFGKKSLILLTPTDIVHVHKDGTWISLGEVNNQVRFNCKLRFDDLDIKDQESIYEWLMM